MYVIYHLFVTSIILVFFIIIIINIMLFLLTSSTSSALSSSSSYYFYHYFNCCYHIYCLYYNTYLFLFVLFTFQVVLSSQAELRFAQTTSYCHVLACMFEQRSWCRNSREENQFWPAGSGCLCLARQRSHLGRRPFLWRNTDICVPSPSASRDWVNIIATSLLFRIVGTTEWCH